MELGRVLGPKQKQIARNLESKQKQMGRKLESKWETYSLESTKDQIPLKFL